MKKNPLNSLMNPQSIATVGASNNFMKMGTMHALSIIKGGFKGKFFPIHPKEEKVLGHKAFKEIKDLPEAPDLAVLIIPTESIKKVLEEFAEIGTKNAIIISAGFKEIGEKGIILEKEIKKFAQEKGLNFVGPNCIGIINTSISLNTTVVSIDNSPGKLGLISQSGTYVAQALPYLKERGIKFSKAISIGNETVINMTDALEYMGKDDETKAIILYIEGIKEGKRFIEVAKKITPHKPVLALYSGGSKAGARSSLSHTGAMASPDFLISGVFKQCGIIRVDTVEELFLHGWALATQPPLKGNRVGIITNSGGPGTSIATTCEKGGMEIPLFSEQLQKDLAELIPGHSPSSNPVDLTFHLDMDALAIKIPELIIRSNEVDSIILHGAMNTGFVKAMHITVKEFFNNVPLEDLLKKFKKDHSEAVSIPYKHKIPMVVSSLFGNNDDYTQAYRDNGINVFDAPEKAAKCMISMAKYGDIKKRKKRKETMVPGINMEASKIIEEAKKNNQKALDEFQSKKILSLYGIPTTREILASSIEEAIDASKKIGFPLVLKACSHNIMHKTDEGLIALNNTNVDMMEKNFKEIKKLAGEDIPILVQEMIKGKREFVAGMTKFPAFGNCILFGLGGIFTEALNDNSIRVAPISSVECEEMIYDINAKKLLGEYRGMPEVDMKTLINILQTLGNISILHQEVSEIDLNPIILQDEKPVVVDALFIL